ncbi:Eco57I restriction-modification methylase domain-containing protein [Tistrella sp. BH-R2-4]|uniref:site-specific DNA-methyltransferase (adenine-specific) n=2 Tax=Geminicoccaceae TaxID=2066434 RepID=A0ABU9YT15_9PROT
MAGVAVHKTVPVRVASPIAAALDDLAMSEAEARGAIFTRREVVGFILDLTGYTCDKPLHRMRLLEPSCGDGDFLLPAIERLLTAWSREPMRGDPVRGDPVAALGESIRAVELHRETFLAVKAKVIGLLIARGVAPAAARRLADLWLIQGDFLLTQIDGAFDVVVGNPPYVRQELIPDVLIAAYRARYDTVFDRADLYIPFIERSLSMLLKGGQLGFICADRWMKNRYGGPLRQFVAKGFHLKIHVDMVGTAAFQADVIAYPAITIIAREKAGLTRIAHRPQIDAAALAGLAGRLLAADPADAPGDRCSIREIGGVVSGSEPWILDSSDQLALVRRLEAAYPALEEAGCRVGIGVATGADAAFIAPFETLDVEPDRKLPLVMTRDIAGGTVAWRGHGVVNPFKDSGGLVDLAQYPRLRRYLEARKDQIANRHIARKAPANWYRTIDRIYPALATTPKLLIPDIKGHAHIVHEGGQFYPHHNLYYITSDVWDLRALQAVLMSGIARLFVAIYTTRMHGGFLRFQAQYLRRIRVPHWQDVPADMRRALIAAAEAGDQAACNRVVFALYDMTPEERAALGGNGD